MIEQRRQFVLGLLTGLAFSLAGSGCGSTTVPVKGKVLKNGQPLEVSNRGVVTVVFYPADSTGDAETEGYAANAGADGSFEIKGKAGQGIPKGRYRVSVFQLDPYPKTDKLEGTFGPDRPPLIKEVTGAEIIIDVAVPSG